MWGHFIISVSINLFFYIQIDLLIILIIRYLSQETVEVQFSVLPGWYQRRFNMPHKNGSLHVYKYRNNSRVFAVNTKCFFIFFVDSSILYKVSFHRQSCLAKLSTLGRILGLVIGHGRRLQEFVGQNPSNVYSMDIIQNQLAENLSCLFEKEAKGGPF